MNETTSPVVGITVALDEPCDFEGVNKGDHRGAVNTKAVSDALLQLWGTFVGRD